MATAYQSNRAKSTQAAKFHKGITVDNCEFDLAATGGAGFVLNDTVDLFKVPKGAKLIDFMIDIPRLDSGGAPTLVLAVGDVQNGAAYYVSGSTKGRTAGGSLISVPNDAVPQTLLVQYTADDKLIFKVTTAPQTAVTTGKIRAAIQYTVDEGGY